MSEITGLTINALTGEEIIAPLSQEELDLIQAAKEERELLELTQQAKVAARASALAKLAELGLTEEEIAAL